jgi:addiction module HigA family antidote
MRSPAALAPVHPGEILREEFLAPLDLTPYASAAELRVPRTRVERLVREETAVTADAGSAARTLLRHHARILARNPSTL